MAAPPGTLDTSGHEEDSLDFSNSLSLSVGGDDHPNKSELDDTEYVDKDQSAMMERRMRHQLMDMESSFLPDASGDRGVVHTDNAQRGHADQGQSHSEGREQELGRVEEQSDEGVSGIGPENTHPEISQTPSAQSEIFKTPGTRFHDKSRESGSVQATPYHDVEGSPTEMPSSPIAAAASRSKAKAKGASHLLPESADSASAEVRAMSRASTVRPAEVPDVHDTSLVADSTESSGMASIEDATIQSAAPLKVSKRPSHLKNRQASARLSQSSTAQRSDASGTYEEGLDEDTDFALQSGGAIPSAGYDTVQSGRPSIALSRLPSLASVASSISGHSEAPWYRKRNTVDTNSARRVAGANGPLGASTSAPSDPSSSLLPSSNSLLFAQSHKALSNTQSTLDTSKTPSQSHTQSIQEAATTKKPKMESPLVSKFANTRNLTIKEHGAVMDRLRKENFEVKLRNHFLEQTLEKHRDENVVNMSKENVQLRLRVVSLEKANKDLKRQLRKTDSDLEDKAKGNNASRPSSRDSDVDMSNTESYTYTLEIDTLEQRISEYEHEIHRLQSAHASKEAELQSMAESLRRKDDQRVRHDDANIEEERARNERVALRTEAGELRRNLEAQTSMLTSRNREREALRKEIEELKLEIRRSERSASLRRPSPQSPEREGALRDQILELKMLNQDLERELNGHLDLLQEAETERDELKRETELILQDVTSLQAERDELLQILDEREVELHNTRNEAIVELEKLEAEVLDNKKIIEELSQEVDAKEEDVSALQADLRRVEEKNALNEDELQSNAERIETLEIQLETTSNEIQFLREEQENDKVKIGDLISSLEDVNKQMENIKTEAESHIEELTAQLQSADSNIDELQSQLAGAKDENRQLRKEASSWKSRLSDLESSLRDALGSIDGTRSNWSYEITRIQEKLEGTILELSTTKSALTEKDRLLRSRDTLLENAGVESRRLSEALEREKQARVNDRKSLTNLEPRFRQQLTERHNLLLALWNRLSTLCGPDWARQNSLVNGELPSVDLLSKNLAGFNKNIISAMKTVENIIGGFRGRVRAVERDLLRDYQTLEHALDVRIKKIDALEKAVAAHGNNSGGGKLIARNPYNMEDDEKAGEWLLRLAELERRLKAEREARLLDRSNARKRLEDEMTEKKQLRERLARREAMQ